MTLRSAVASHATQAAPQEGSAEIHTVSRLPILDLEGRVHGYELIFRNPAPETQDGNLATRTLLDDVVLYGLERYTGGLPAVINCTAEALAEELVGILPPAVSILGIPEALAPTPELLDACLRLKADGFRLAVDATVRNPARQPLLDLADYIRVDFSRTTAAGRQELCQSISHSRARLSALKVETPLDFQQARAEGFTLFQGFYFCRPTLVRDRKLPTNRLFHFQILQELYRESVDLKKLSQLVMRDAALTYRLLRFVNSPLNAIRQEVRSVESALLLVGADSFRRIATVAILSEQNSGQPSEVLNMSFVRGLFCEMAASQCALDPSEQYLLGLFSLLPAMLHVPMEDLVPNLPLRDPIRNALLGAEIPERCLLHWLECHEQGDWAGCDAIMAAYQPRFPRLNPEQLILSYNAAVAGAEVAMRSATANV